MSQRRPKCSRSWSSHMWGKRHGIDKACWRTCGAAGLLTGPLAAPSGGTSVLQVRKLKHSEVKSLARGHTPGNMEARIQTQSVWLLSLCFLLLGLAASRWAWLKWGGKSRHFPFFVVPLSMHSEAWGMSINNNSGWLTHTSKNRTGWATLKNKTFCQFYWALSYNTGKQHHETITF